MKKVLLFIISFLMIIPINCLAITNVSYSGSSHKFIYDSDGKEINNLFDNFNDVMPGDKIEENIVINNPKSNNVKIKLYLKSFGTSVNTNEFLSKLKLNVKLNKKTILFDSSANLPAELEDYVYLGEIYSGGKIDLDLILEVPKELDNSYQNMSGDVNWEFKIEELPVESTDPVPNTLDNIYIYIGILLISVIVLAIIIIYIKKDNNKKKK